jgi:predicted amidophosphoribosyltransferase
MKATSEGLKQPNTEAQLSYYLCPRCQRAVPAEAHETYCPNDGSPLLQACHHCGAAITSPYGHFCTACGQEFFFIENKSL